MTRTGSLRVGRAAVLLLAMLLAADLLYLLVHVAWLAGGGEKSPLYSLKHDRGYAEWYQYLKLLWTGLLLALVAGRERSVAALAWMVVALVLLFDDAFWLHEHFGGLLGRWLALPALGPLSPGDLGELVYAAIVGIAVLPLLAAGWWLDRSHRLLMWRMGLALGLLVAFAMGIDTLDEFMPGVLETLLATAEDFGEMLAVSLMTAFAFDAAQGLSGTAQ